LKQLAENVVSFKRVASMVAHCLLPFRAVTPNKSFNPDWPKIRPAG